MTCWHSLKTYVRTEQNRVCVCARRAWHITDSGHDASLGPLWQVAGKNSTQFRVRNSVDSIVTFLTVGVTVISGDFHNISTASAVVSQCNAGGDAVLRILARDEYGNEIDQLVQPPLLDIFTIPETTSTFSSATAVASPQANPVFTLVKSEGARA